MICDVMHDNDGIITYHISTLHKTPLLLPLEQHIANKQQELTKHRTNMLSIDTNYENTLQNMKLKINTMQESMKTKYSMMKGLKEKL